jgi:hypothetical protein
MTQPRRFTLVDAMVLVAAVGASLALMRPYMLGITLLVTHRRPYLLALSAPAHYGPTFLVPLTVAALALRLRRPRPPIRRAFRGLGMVGCLASIPGIALANAPSPRGPMDMPGPFWLAGGFEAGLCVLGAWVALVAQCRWCREPDWVGWLGRAISLGWLASGAGVFAAPFLNYFQ